MHLNKADRARFANRLGKMLSGQWFMAGVELRSCAGRGTDFQICPLLQVAGSALPLLCAGEGQGEGV